MANIKERLEGIVGKENASDDDSVLGRYARDESFATPMTPSCVVKVSSVDQVEKIVKLANETKTTLVPVSSSGPHHKGDTVPSVPGSVIVDMSGMKRILNINRQQRMVVVEPGVTYGELQASLADQGMEISIPSRPGPGSRCCPACSTWSRGSTLSISGISSIRCAAPRSCGATAIGCSPAMEL